MVRRGIDVLILGCTHYPLLKTTIKKVVGQDVTLIDSAEETANELLRIVTSDGISSSGKKETTRDFYLTDNSETFIDISGKFLGNEISEIKVTDIT